jgi:hypothetical protein
MTNLPTHTFDVPAFTLCLSHRVGFFAKWDKDNSPHHYLIE